MPSSQTAAKQLPLHPDHAAQGAVFGRVGAWELPLRFTDPLREYAASHKAAALADVSHWGKLLFQGPDRLEFLHGLLTNDLKDLALHQGLPACLLTHKGKLVADLWLYRRSEDFLALQAPQATAPLMEALKKNIPLSETTQQDVSDHWAAFALMGPAWGKGLEKTLGQKIALGPRACLMENWKDLPLWIFSHPPLAAEGAVILLPVSRGRDFWSALADAGKPHGLERIGQEALEMRRLEAGVPLLGVDMDADNYPVEVRLEDAISYTKGCYLGQETVARIKHHGRVPRALAGLRVQGPAAPGDSVLHNGEPVARVTSAAPSPRLNATLALAQLPHPHSAPGAAFTVAHQGQELPAVVTALPLA